MNNFCGWRRGNSAVLEVGSGPHGMRREHANLRGLPHRFTKHEEPLPNLTLFAVYHEIFLVKGLHLFRGDDGRRKHERHGESLGRDGVEFSLKRMDLIGDKQHSGRSWTIQGWL